MDTYCTNCKTRISVELYKNLGTCPNCGYSFANASLGVLLLFFILSELALAAFWWFSDFSTINDTTVFTGILISTWICFGVWVSHDAIYIYRHRGAKRPPRWGFWLGIGAMLLFMIFGDNLVENLAGHLHGIRSQT